MKTLFFPVLIASLVLPLVPGAHGQLARERGLSQSESAAVGAVIHEAAGARGNASDAAANVPARRYSPDYYRVYSRRMQAPGTAKRVATAAPTARPAPAATPKPAPVKPSVAVVRKVAVLPPVAKVRVRATPTPAPVKPPAVRRVAVAAPIAKPKVAATPKPVAVRPRAAVAKIPPVKPVRVLMLPPGTKSRTIVVPVSPMAPAPIASRRAAVLPPVAKRRKADETIYVAPKATGPVPIRAAFREPDRR